MAAPSLDNEFMQYWSQLSVVEKESLMNIARTYVQLKAADDTTDLRKSLILAERAAYLQGEGANFTWEQVKSMALNKEERNVL